MNQGPSPHIGELAQRRLSGTRSQDKLLGDILAALVVAAIRQDCANLVKHNVHVGLRTLVEVAHGLSSNAAKLTPDGAARTQQKPIHESRPGAMQSGSKVDLKR